MKQLPELKKECEWLKEVNAQSLQQSIHNMDIAFKKFFKGAGFPKFKSKHKGKQSFSVPQNVIVENNLLIIPKFKEGIDDEMAFHRLVCGIKGLPPGRGPKKRELEPAMGTAQITPTYLPEYSQKLKGFVDENRGEEICRYIHTYVKSVARNLIY